jgi:hypothetical protein
MNSAREPRERRFTPRAELSLPVALRPAEDSALPDQRVESLNMSRLGMYFASPVEIPEGTKVEMRFAMPREISGKPENFWRCMGRVIRVDRKGRLSGKFGIGVRFDYYELMTP